MKLSIITLTYNNLEYTKKYIDSLYKYTSDFELIIVDNGSTDGTKEYLKTIDGIKLIINDSNLGFSKGNNLGLEIAKGEYIGFLNNDILLYPNWFEDIENVFNEKPNAGFISPVHVNPHYDRTNEKNYINFFKRRIFADFVKKSFDECCFSCVVTKRSVLDKIGYFDENISPAFYEDNDLKYRAVEAGFDLYADYRVCFFHFGSITSINFSDECIKNRAYYYSKHRFAEYQASAGGDIQACKLEIKRIKDLPSYRIHVFFQEIRKIKNNIIKRIKNETSL